jgi:hypothetical protein
MKDKLEKVDTIVSTPEITAAIKGHSENCECSRNVEILGVKNEFK